MRHPLRTIDHMSDDDVTLEMSIPLDDDGFLRRACPTCEREFKWLPSTDDEEAIDSPEVDHYFCPYCGVQAPADSWLTEEQIALAHNIVEREVLGPMFDEFRRDMNRTSRRSGGIVSVSVEHSAPDELDPLSEPNDMRRVDFPCHPTEPVKVADDWRNRVYCLLCGTPTA